MEQSLKIKMISKKPDWIQDGEKYALMGLSVKIDEAPVLKKLSSRFFVFGDSSFSVPSHWREWLGTIRVEEVESCNLFLLTKIKSENIHVLDGENQKLSRDIGEFYLGLLLSSFFAPEHKPIQLTGSCVDGEVTVREHSEFAPPMAHPFLFYPSIPAGALEYAAGLGEDLAAFNAAPISEGRWRFNRTMDVYINARTNPHILDQLHQYCRCIDGLILSEAGKGKKQFKDRTQLFIGEEHNEAMSEAYEVRSNVEHLNENRYLAKYDREVRLGLLRHTVMLEYIARKTLAKILNDEKLWPHFANVSGMKGFWDLDTTERRKIWGEPFDISEALTGYRPEYLSDAQLGAA